jgi:hypothetical protein
VISARKFLDFFQTKTGQLVAFAATVTVAGGLYYGLRTSHGESEAATSPVLPTKEAPAQDHPVTVNRGGTPLVLPDVLGIAGAIKSAPKLPPRLPITLYDGGPDGPEVSDTYAPYGRLIPCETVITIDSAKIETPIIGFVTEDVYHNGKLIIPAGAEVHGKARTDRSRERIASDNQWYIVWRTTDQMNGAELSVNGIALDMDRDYANGRWAIADGSAGLRGDLIKSDNWAEIKLFAATFLSAAAGGLQDNQNIFNPMTGGYQQSPLDSPKNAALQGTSAVLNQYAQQIADSIKQNGFYVRVPAGKQFYLYVMQTLDQEKAQKAESLVHQPSKPSTP